MAIPILSDIFGQKPQIAGFQDVILGDEQIKALLADLKAFPQIQQLGNLWQNYMLAGIEHAVPGFGDILSGMTGTTKEELNQASQLMQGVMPKDVIARTFQTGAMQGLLSGTGGSPMGAANQARQFGLTELDLFNQGANLLGNASQRWQQMANFGQSTLMPIQNMLITPEQQAAQTQSNRLIQRQIQQERFNVAAAPNPIAKGLSDIVMYLTGQYLGSLGGGKMGGGAGGLPQAGNAAAVSAEGNVAAVPAGGLGGAWAALTGQPYDAMGGGAGASATIGYGATPYTDYGAELAPVSMSGAQNVAAYPTDPFSAFSGAGYGPMSGFGSQWDPSQMNIWGEG